MPLICGNIYGEFFPLRFRNAIRHEIMLANKNVKTKKVLEGHFKLEKKKQYQLSRKRFT